MSNCQYDGHECYIPEKYCGVCIKNPANGVEALRERLAAARGLLRLAEVALIRTHPHPGLLQASLDDGSAARLMERVGEAVFDPDQRLRALLGIRAFLAAHPAAAPDEFSIHCANCYWRWTGAMCHGPYDRAHCPVLAGRDLGEEWRQAAVGSAP